MSLPVFYCDELRQDSKEILLNEDTSRHVVNVLRMEPGQELELTDGKGNLTTAVITDNHKKHCAVNIISNRFREEWMPRISLAVSLLKTTARFEWLLEKCTEIGINEIVPVICERTVKEKFRFERMKGICISAMLQSQQAWLPRLSQPASYKEVVMNSKQTQKFIGHCANGEKKELAATINSPVSSSIVLIGPEGDFTENEISLALDQGFVPVSLGNTRLRTETAAVVASTLLRL
jgi:16S rRNA (uracil1498-N3)-methyltransferase